MKKITILQNFWFGGKKIALTFPNKWRVNHCRCAADGWRRLSPADMRKAIDQPIGCGNLESIARGKREAVILFDDMTRPTRPYKIIPHILQKLKKGGMRKKNIRFIVSSASHGACTSKDFRKKLGDAVVADYPVYNHNCFENCVYAGRTKRGVPLYLNKEFMSCDLKIGIGSAFPHVYSGFSGGGKIVLPGISHIKTIEKFHSLRKAAVRFGGERENVCARSFNEAARLAGLQFKIDFVLNTDGDEVACFAGDPQKVFKEAVSKSRKAYLTPHDKNYDVIIANAYMKSNEADLAIHNVKGLLNAKKGMLILVTHNPHGQVNHYLLRSYGKFIGGRQYKIRTFLKSHIKYIIFSPHKDYKAFDTFDKPDSLIWKRSWGDILKIIKRDFSNPKIAVFKDATIQLL